jgi:hypothetical protein
MHHLEEKHAQEAGTSSAFVDPKRRGVGSASKHSKSMKTRNDEFWNIYRVPIVAGIKFSWSLDRNSNVATNVYDVLKSIKHSPILRYHQGWFPTKYPGCPGRDSQSVSKDQTAP